MELVNLRDIFMQNLVISYVCLTTNRFEYLKMCAVYSCEKVISTCPNLNDGNTNLENLK
jgi:hypothetical protein